jgi:hypothetical protein
VSAAKAAGDFAPTHQGWQMSLEILILIILFCIIVQVLFP